MAEKPRRVELTSVLPLANNKKSKSHPPTIRLEISLTESTLQNCPEINYKEKLQKQSKAQSEDDPFGDGDEQDKLEAIARGFEEKYGTGKLKAKRVGNVRDLVDLGEGYDEEDSFIDNEEAYDELVPSCLTTKYGGFYINKEQLDFKYMSASDGESNEKPVKKKKKRMIIESDSGSLSERPPKKIKKSMDKLKRKSNLALKKKVTAAAAVVNSSEVKRRRGRPRLDEEEKKQRKQERAKQRALAKRSLNATPSTPNVSQSPNITSQSQTPVGVTASSTALTTSTGVTPSGGPSSPGQDDCLLEMFAKEMAELIPSEGANNSDGLNDLDSVLKSMSQNEATERAVSPPFVDQPGGIEQSPVTNEERADLPQDLPSNLLKIITDLTEASRSSKLGKTKFFTPEINKLLLNLETLTKQISCSKRSRVYNYLGRYLPCNKETLLKRAKKLKLDDEGSKIAQPLQRLACAIAKAKDDGERKQSIFDKDGFGTDNGRSVYWSEDVRQCLCETVSQKMRCYEFERTRQQTSEDYVKSFLTQQCLPLWPFDSINIHQLYHESSPAHERWTNKSKRSYVTTLKQPVVGSYSVRSPSSDSNSARPQLASPPTPLQRQISSDTVDSSSPDTRVSRLPTPHARPKPEIKPIEKSTIHAMKPADKSPLSRTTNEKPSTVRPSDASSLLAKVIKSPTSCMRSLLSEQPLVSESSESSLHLSRTDPVTPTAATPSLSLLKSPGDKLYKSPVDKLGIYKSPTEKLSMNTTVASNKLIVGSPSVSQSINLLKHYKSAALQLPTPGTKSSQQQNKMSSTQKSAVVTPVSRQAIVQRSNPVQRAAVVSEHGPQQTAATHPTPVLSTTVRHSSPAAQARPLTSPHQRQTSAPHPISSPEMTSAEHLVLPQQRLDSQPISDLPVDRTSPVVNRPSPSSRLSLNGAQRVGDSMLMPQSNDGLLLNSRHTDSSRNTNTAITGSRLATSQRQDRSRESRVEEVRHMNSRLADARASTGSDLFSSRADQLMSSTRPDQLLGATLGGRGDDIKKLVHTYLSQSYNSPSVHNTAHNAALDSTPPENVASTRPLSSSWDTAHTPVTRPSTAAHVHSHLSSVYNQGHDYISPAMYDQLLSSGLRTDTGNQHFPYHSSQQNKPDTYQ